MKIFLVSSREPELDIIQEYIDRLEYSFYLRDEPVEIILAYDGLNAYKKIEGYYAKGLELDIVISAMTMPGLDGIQLVEYLKSDNRLSNIPVILFGRDVSKKLLADAKAKGVKAILLLPFRFENFKDEITGVSERLIKEEEGKRQDKVEAFFKNDTGFEYQGDMDLIYLSSLKKINELRRLAPWSVNSGLALAKVHCGMDNFETALPILKKVVRQKFDLKEGHKLLSLCYKKLGKSYEEIDELKEAVKTNSKSTYLNEKLGEAYLREGDYQEAREYFLKAIKYKRINDTPRQKAKPHVGMGNSYLAEANDSKKPSLLENAVDHFDNGKRIDPTLLSAYCGLNIALKKMGENEKASKVFKEIINIAPSTSEDWQCLFSAYLNEGDDRKSRAALAKSLEYDPENQVIMINAAQAYMRQNMFQEALNLFNKAAEVNPSDKRIYNFIGMCCRRLGEYDKSIDAYLTAITIDSEDASIHFNMGTLYDTMGKKDEAKVYFQKALELDPSLNSARERLRA